MAKKIYIYDIIGPGGISPKDIDEQLNIANGEMVYVMVNSSGGAVFEGMAIYNAIKKYKGTTRAYIEGVAYGIASIIVLACDEIWMKKGAYMGIIEPKIYQIDGIENEATPELDKNKNAMAEIYMEKSKKTKTEIFKIMEQAAWLTDKGAEVEGFIDVVYE